MPSFSRSPGPLPYLISCAVTAALLLLAASGLVGQALIGSVAGPQVELRGVVRLEAGLPVVSSGTVIEVARGQAELKLLRGGSIRICGPARISVIQGGKGAYLISLQQGAIDLRYASSVADSVLTPDFRVDTVVPPGQFSSTSASLALDDQGRLCVDDQGSALILQAMAGGSGRSLVAGDHLLFNPSTGEAAPVPSCTCAARPSPVPETPRQQQAVGDLFPRTSSLLYSHLPAPPAPQAAPAPGSVASVPPPPAPAAPAASRPAPGNAHHRGFFHRLFGWLFPHGRHRS